MYIGIDCGTQGTKAIVVDSRKKQVIGVGYAAHEMIENTQGRREQKLEWWTQALVNACQQAIKQAQIEPHLIKGIGVSGQQHGLVVLDEHDQPLYPAKLWCDTETAVENEQFIEALGGQQAAFEQLGIMVQTGYTASKLAWLRKHFPQKYQSIAKIMLPHDYLNYWLTGQFCMEYGDASGTGFFDIHNRTWHQQAFSKLAPELDIQKVLPPLLSAEQKIGTLRAEVAQLLGLSEQVVVSTGGGDNMMGAIGTGNIKQGIATMSLGTSGTLYAYTDKPLANLPMEIANFCSSSGGWLPLVCVMNMTSANRNLMELLDINVEKFNQLIEQSPIGAEGIRILPFFNGERVPPLPQAKASILGLDSANFTQANLARAMMEAASFTLRYGLDLFRQAGLSTQQIRLIGGGAKSAIWRQMIADIMNAEVVCLKEEEAGALGAAIQAMWANGEADLASLCEQFVKLDEQSKVQPNPQSAVLYEGVYQTYLVSTRVPCKQYQLSTREDTTPVRNPN
ncbi:xylulokinase [Canicola haemoglobinophilus]|uniref:Xylulose kinase n=2 Tax=Canicola haemoglobinophilus TaxID=733 RepID=A0A377HSS9_9PAST|nr:xylulokinase [Canicola haemoglobinophilus]STO59358.1 xylulokinase [Canicola haemoglobinophilus]